jgi:ectoine hydroxylase-related dioxygenase (phytanoyl-CoA dioxygenase family)
VPITPENGSTEIWLGTHTSDISAQEGAHGERDSGRIRQVLLDKRAEICPPVQPTINKGGLMIRDLRLWHAGMPNRTDKVRVMLAMIHFAAWYRNPMRLRLSKDIRLIIEKLEKEGNLGLEAPVGWITREEAAAEYLNRGSGNSYDFNQTT